MNFFAVQPGFSVYPLALSGAIDWMSGALCWAPEVVAQPPNKATARSMQLAAHTIDAVFILIMVGSGKRKQAKNE
jgi:hypothetical protein